MPARVAIRSTLRSAYELPSLSSPSVACMTAASTACRLVVRASAIAVQRKRRGRLLCCAAVKAASRDDIEQQISHKLWPTGENPVVLPCCCAPPSSHDDTVLIGG